MKLETIVTYIKYNNISFLFPGDMEEDESESYLDKLPLKFSSEVRELLTYNEDTAGGIMEKAQRDPGTPGGNSVTGEDEQAINQKYSLPRL